MIHDDANAIFPNTAAAAINTPPVGQIVVFSEGDKLKQKNSAGVITDFTTLQAGYARTKITADVVNAAAVANTSADVTGLSFAVNANTTYKFRFVIFYTAALATTGSRWTINTPTFAVGNLIYRSEWTLTAASRTVNEGLIAAGLPAASNASSLTVGNIAIIEGFIKPSLAGAVQAQFASEILASAITAKVNSYVEYEVL